MNTSVNKLIKKGFVPIKQSQEFTALKSNNAMVVCYSDGETEGFVKNSNGSEQINEINSRHLIEGILILGLGLSYFNTDLTIVRGVSMEPTFKNNMLIVRSKLTTNLKKLLVSRNSIVKFKDKSGDICIKRVVGLPGDMITFQGFNVYINGKLIDKSNRNHFVKQQQLAIGTKGNKKDLLERKTEFKLKQNEYFVLGDNREYSVDSREFGPIQSSSILSIISK